jgi:hypothetical protein
MRSQLSTKIEPGIRIGATKSSLGRPPRFAPPRARRQNHGRQAPVGTVARAKRPRIVRSCGLVEARLEAKRNKCTPTLVRRKTYRIRCVKRILVGAVGIEPTTFGLKGRCSTTELRPSRGTCDSIVRLRDEQHTIRRRRARGGIVRGGLPRELSIGRRVFAQLGQAAAALALPDVILPQFLLVLFHLRFDVRESGLRAGANVAALSGRLKRSGGKYEV